MSTKLYHGVILEYNGLNNLHSNLQVLRDILVPIVQNNLKSFAVWSAINKLDRKVTGLLSKEEILKYNKSLYNNSALGVTYNEIHDRQLDVKNKNKLDDLVDFGLDLCLFPTSIQDNTILGLYFAVNKAVINTLMDQSFVNEFAYWDNTDLPDSISEQEWDRRSQRWDKALQYSDIPAEAGFTYNLSRVDCFNPFSDEFRVSKDNYLKYVTSLENRVNYLAPALAKKQGPVFNKPYDYIQWTRTDEYKKTLEKSKQELSKLIEKNITFELLHQRTSWD